MPNIVVPLYRFLLPYTKRKTRLHTSVHAVVNIIVFDPTPYFITNNILSIFTYTHIHTDTHSAVA